MHWLTLRQLKSGNSKSRLKAAKELWQEPNARSLNGLADALGPEAIPALKLTYETGPVASAVRAVEAMGSVTDPAAVKMLCQALHHQEPAVCIAAVGALGNIGGGQAVQALVPCLRNVNP